VFDQAEDMNEAVETGPINQDDIHENRPVIPIVDSVKTIVEIPSSHRQRVDVADAQAKWDALQPHKSGTDNEEDDSVISSRTNPEVPLIPSLKKESTSVDDWAKFEDIEDFPDYDEFAEGEEFIERKWMEEQARLEAAEQGDEESFNGFDNEPFEQPPDEKPTSKCPICDSSLKGVDSDLATRHVNGCLDGNSVPLPAVKQESKEVKMMNPDAKNRFARKAAVARPGQANPFEINSSSTASSSAFSKLMSGHAEDAAWAAASASEQASRGKPAYQRTCPFYKIMPGFSICVDAFRYGAVQGCKAYFLSHFHSDHYIGLTSSWCHGPIYCSKVTANLVKQQLRVDPKWVIALEFEQRFEVPGTNGVAVTMIPANHCPGSSLFLYEKVVSKGTNPKVQRVLHCGDFRACPAHISHPLLMPDLVDSITGKTKQQKIDVCYLDTTYLNPRYSFPSQEEVIKACADMCVSLKKERAEENDAWEVVKRERAGTGMAKFVNSAIKPEDDSIAMSLATTNNKPRGRLLVICGTYSIGKERICLGIARALNCKIWAPPGKMKICKALEDEELWSRMTDDPKEAQIHMQMLMEIRAETLQEYLNGYKPHFSRIVGFRPSGWNYRPPNSRYVFTPFCSSYLTYRCL
jgi:DNA cross-link repair 1A protein